MMTSVYGSSVRKSLRSVALAACAVSLDSLADQNTAVKNTVERIRSLGSAVRESDQPLDAWLADWEALVSGREDYLSQQRRGFDTTFRVPHAGRAVTVTGDREEIDRGGLMYLPFPVAYLVSRGLLKPVG